MKYIVVSILALFSFQIQAQKKVLSHEDKASWNRIRNVEISRNGDHVLHALEKEEQDQTLLLKSIKGNILFKQERSNGGGFTYDSKQAVFTIKAWKDSITEMKRRKVKKKDMPMDTLGIYNIESGSITKIANIKSYKIPEKWSGIVTYMLEPIKIKKDTTKSKVKDTLKVKSKLKKVSKDHGFHVVIRDLNSSKEDTLKYVLSHAIAKEGKFISYATTGIEDKIKPGVYIYDIEKGTHKMIYETHPKSKFPQLSISNTGEKTAFVVDTDSTKSLIKQPLIYTWKTGQDNAELVMDSKSNNFNLLVSKDEKLMFSKNEKRLFFGMRPEQFVQDTTLLDEEIVNVEVWTYDEPRLYTVQELDVKNDKKKAFLSLYDFDDKKIVKIADKNYDNAEYSNEGNGRYAVIGNLTPYRLESQWTAQYAIDIQRVDLKTGERSTITNKLYGMSGISPNGKYAYGYSRKDSTWYTYNLSSLKYSALTKGKQFYTEDSDYPDDPRSYGSAGWTDDDKQIIIYDRYDIWSFDPESGKSARLTNGRESKTRYRYVKLDREERSISAKGDWLLSTFNEDNKRGGFYSYNAKNNNGKQILEGPYTYENPWLSQGKENNNLLITRQSFTDFPDLYSTDLSFKSLTKISDANPQQADYNWGTAELVEWVSLDGIPLKGMLIKPENFDPNKKYPMLVNFYEKSSDGLHRHRPPSYGRSSINYSFYASRGYLIFNPDVNYRVGYPGESALNCVIPGVTALIDKGFVDKDNIGVQGHSWGGYQIAYLVTKTDIFKAAESGAPVANMISAYGGIRWWTGLSRQFQYEHTQSRIGGTPWEYPQRYVENSPIFNIDKINTPLLIMHNDADGHVPWYQGIEFFVSLRRLGKPSWFLNYNGEPHWPLKMQNRKDFNLRMTQFFDYYLKGAAKPLWMERGVPALEKGINQGYELIKEQN